jgi:hypothetical protein
LDHRERFGRRCDLGLRPPASPRGDAWTCDHIEAVINGGANGESNLRRLCEWCEPPKTEDDVHEKSRSDRRRLRHAGKLPPKGRPLPGNDLQGGNTGMALGAEGPASRRALFVGLGRWFPSVVVEGPKLYFRRMSRRISRRTKQ